MAYYSPYYVDPRLCGCWFPVKKTTIVRQYLPQVELSSHTNILATSSRTTLTQTFVNDQDHSLDEVHYTFPLYDGVSVVGFKCVIGSKVIVGKVKERQQARAEYQQAVERGETAGLFEQLPEASDVFTTSIGNVPAKEKLHVELVYLGELKHDAETDGSRFTIPTKIAPRYGSLSSDSAEAMSKTQIDNGRIAISVDVTLEEGSIVRGLQSPSHPIAVTMGRTSIMAEDSFNNNYASATLTLGTTVLDKDFVIVVLAKDIGIPRALLETHPTIANQRALMTTLVPKFNLPNISPEIVFVVDRSGSMQGKIEILVSAMRVFLKSLPVGVKFNICSFGSTHSFLFEKSRTYDQSSLKDALAHLDSFAADFGGTEMLPPVKATVEKRFKDLPLEVMVLTDGETFNQQQLFTFVNETPNARFFSLGIGHGASSALVEGIARAGNGFAQFVGPDEKMDNRLIRMLKGALAPHVTDYTLEVRYADIKPDSDDEGFEIVERAHKEKEEEAVAPVVPETETKKPISLFDPSATEAPTNPPTGRYDNLPIIPVPKILQAPHKIPALFPFTRTTVYLLLTPEATQKTPKSVVLRGTSAHGPLELEFPVQDIGVGETIHQMAAKRAILDIEEGRGWIVEARKSDGQLWKNANEGKWDLMIEREAVRLGVEFQVGGKYCSFVAVDTSGKPIEESVSAPRVSQSPRTQLFCARASRPNAPMAAMAIASPPPTSSAPRGRVGGSLLFGGTPPPRQTDTGLFSSVHLPTPTTSSAFGGGGGPGGAGLSSPVHSAVYAPMRKPSGPLEMRFSAVRAEGSAHKASIDLSTLSATEKMHQIIGLVQFDGKWLRSKDLLTLLGITEQQFASVNVSIDEDKDAVRATALAVAWLTVKLPAEKDTWEMVADKATQWLATKLGNEDNAKKAIEGAESVF